MSEAPDSPAAAGPEGTSDTEPPPPPRGPGEGWAKRWSRRALGGVIALVAVVVLVVGWLGATDSGLRAVMGLAARLSGGIVTVERTEGYLLGQLKIGALHVRTPTLHVDILNLLIDWRPGALMSGALKVSTLTASEVVVATVPSTEPASLPASLALPRAVHIDHFELDRLLIGKLVDAQPAPPDMEFTAIAGALESDGRHHRLSGLKALAPFGQLAADAEIDGQRPFPLKAHASLATRQAGEAYDVQADATGDLEDLKLLAKASGAGMSGDAAIQATPFAALPLRSAKLMVRDVDPSRFHASAPKARLDIDADLAPSTAKTAVAGEAVTVADWVVSGPVKIVNRQPGTYDSGALPLESLAASLRWAGGELAASGLDLRVPGNGRATGTLRWQAPDGKDSQGFGKLDAELRITGLDAKRLDQRAVATRIDGQISAKADADSQTLTADLSDPQLALRLKARHSAGLVTLDEVLATARAARLEASGKLALNGDGRFDARGTLTHFDPRAFVVTAPPADLNTRFSVAGQRVPQLAGKLQFALTPSTLEGKPLAGKGELALDGSRLSDADLSLELAGNRLSAKGRYGKAGDALDVHLDAPALAALGHGLGGRIKADGVLRGSPAQAAGEFVLQGDKLSVGAVRIDAVNGRGNLAEGRNGAISVTLGLAGLHKGKDVEAVLQRASLVFEGTRAANTARLEVFGPKQVSGVLSLAGALSEGPRWEGRLESLAVRGDYPFTLQAPAPLLLSADSVRLGLAELRGGAGGRYRFEETRWQARHLLARGSVSGVQVGVAIDPATRAVKSRGDSLQIGGEWDVDIADQVNGFVRFYREKGDLVLQGDSPVQLGLDDLQLTASAAANRIAFGFSAHGSKLGSAAGAGTALAERTADGTIRLVPDAPLLGSAQLDIPSIAWAGPLADQNLKTDGSLKGEFTLAGTPAHPETAGRIRGEALSFVMADQGLHLSGGTLVADFNKDRLNLEEFSFVSPNRVKPRESRIDVAALTRLPGTLKARGEVQLASGEGRFIFKADRLPLLQRTDQWLVLSGEGEVLSGWSSAHLKGRMLADAGFVELSRTPAPSLGDDVEVLDPRKNGKPPASPFLMSVDLAIGLGNALYVKALGLDTRLAGDLHLQSGPGKPLNASGVITAQGGVFEGYGQKLSIERGIVTFNGPIANPGLNVVALRKGLSVEAGVGITGTARRPVVRLVSEPNVPDPEKLGWIVLGRPPDQGSGGEMALLLPAAQALLGGTGGGISASLANALGFDELSLGSSVDARNRVQTSSVATGSVTGTASSASSSNVDSVPGQVITIGKRLSTRALLTFEQSIAGTSSIVKLTYQLTRRISVVGRAGSENAVDMLFTLSFR
jgi:translocation and assembly module TamB